MAAKRTIMLDKYARDARAWRDFAEHNYAASAYLFNSGNPFLIFAAATLGHHCLEMYLKAALICEGFTVFDPNKIRILDTSVTLRESQCAWGHDLVALAHQVAASRPDFDLGQLMNTLAPWVQDAPLTVEKGFELFNPFFSELRYPQELKTMGGVGELDKLLLDELVDTLRPFVGNIR